MKTELLNIFDPILGHKVVKLHLLNDKYYDPLLIIEFDNGIYITGIDGGYGDNALKILNKTEFTKLKADRDVKDIVTSKENGDTTHD